MHAAVNVSICVFKCTLIINTCFYPICEALFFKLCVLKTDIQIKLLFLEMQCRLRIRTTDTFSVIISMNNINKIVTFDSIMYHSDSREEESSDSKWTPV